MRFIQRFVRPALLSAALLLSFAHAASASYIAQDVNRNVKAATVMVHIEYDAPGDSRVSWGTGFVVGDGLIMTNAHVVRDDTPLRIYVHNEYLPATEARVATLRYDPDGRGRPGSSYYDVALLSYRPPAGVRLPVLPFSLDTTPNQSVFAFGYPGSSVPRFSSQGAYGAASVPQTRLVVTGGVINQVISANPNLVMHDALCASGNSGGPLVNARGEVVGMQTWSADPDYRNIVESFAIGSGGLVLFMQANGFGPFIAR